MQEGGQLFHHARAQGLCLRQLLRLPGRKLRAEALGVLFKGGAPVRRFQLPGVGVVLQKGDVVRRKAAQLRLQKAQHALGGKAPGGQLQRGKEKRGHGRVLQRERRIAEHGHARQLQRGQKRRGILLHIAADERHVAVGHALARKRGGAAGGGAALLIQGGRRGEPHLASQRGGRRFAAAYGSHCGGEARRAGVAQVFLQKLRPLHRHVKAARGAHKAGRRAFYGAEQAKAAFIVRKAVAAKGHGAAFGLQKCIQQGVLRLCEAVEIVQEHSSVRQLRRRQAARGKQQAVGGVHGAFFYHLFIRRKHKAQLAQLFAVRAFGLADGHKVLRGGARDFQLFNGLCAHIAEIDAAAVPAVKLHRVAQDVHGAAHCHGARRVGKRRHRHTAVRFQHLFGIAFEAVHLGVCAEAVPQRGIHHAFRRGRELLRHQQHAFSGRSGARLHARQHKACLACSRRAQHKLQHTLRPLSPKFDTV